MPFLLSAPELELSLARLGLTSENVPSKNWPYVPLTSDNLLTVYYRFITTIPFANLDWHRCKPTILHRSAIFQKLMVNRKGGICYEVHGLLALLLESLGFAVQVVPVFVNRNRDVNPLVADFFLESTHANTLVAFEDEKGDKQHFVCEMGLGTVSMPLRAEFDVVQHTSEGQQYRFTQADEWAILELKGSTGWVPRFRMRSEDFRLTEGGDSSRYPFPEAFLPGAATASQPGSAHQVNAMVYKLRTALPSELKPPSSLVTCSVVDGVFAETRRSAGEPTSRSERKIASAREYFDLLKHEFGLDMEHDEPSLDLAVLLESDRSLKPSPRFPVFLLEDLQSAHRAFLQDSKEEAAREGKEEGKGDNGSVGGGNGKEEGGENGKGEASEGNEEGIAHKKQKTLCA